MGRVLVSIVVPSLLLFHKVLISHNCLLLDLSLSHLDLCCFGNVCIGCIDNADNCPLCRMDMAISCATAVLKLSLVIDGPDNQDKIEALNTFALYHDTGRGGILQDSKRAHDL